MLPLLVGSAAGMSTEETALSYDVVGFDVGDVDEAPRGGELLCAGPGERLALYNPIQAQVLLLDAARDVAAVIDVDHVGSMAFDAAGRLVVYAPHTRQLTLFAPDGQLLSSAALPDIVPPGGTVVAADATVFIADVFGNLHRAARLAEGQLLPPQGPTLVQGGGRVRWSGDTRTMTVDGVEWPLPDALKASGRLVGSDWLLVDEVRADAPIVATRTAILRETGAAYSLPVEARAYVPRADVVADEAGRLLFLDPRPDALYLVEVTP